MTIVKKIEENETDSSLNQTIKIVGKVISTQKEKSDPLIIFDYVPPSYRSFDNTHYLPGEQRQQSYLTQFPAIF